MKNNYEWLNKKTPRSVDQLKLWPENPRLNPEETHIYLSDFAEDLTFEETDKKHFFTLIKSIAEDTFIPADPIVVWKDEHNDKFYVAEGNRRVLALKLLRDPQKAPKSIRSFVRSQSQKINKNDIEKIYVNVAPTFEDAEWYINQRNSTSSLQQSWSRVQQQRWITELYEKYSGDTEKITSITKLTKGELEAFIRILKIKDLVSQPEVKAKLTEEEFRQASSYKFPITILERFFSNKEVKDQWGFDFDGVELKYKNKTGFLNSYSHLVKNIVSKDKNRIIIDTRTITSNFDEIFSKLPKVVFDNNIILETGNYNTTELAAETKEDLNNIDTQKNNNTIVDPKLLKNNPSRGRLILSIYSLNTDSNRLLNLFEELKRIPFSYKNSIAASMRVFLDLSVFKHIETEALENAISSKYSCSFREVSLKYRLEYLKTNHLNDANKKIITRLLEPKNDFSLDVLNGFVHSDSSSYLSQDFLNRFWDFLFPLFQSLLDIKEK